MKPYKIIFLISLVALGLALPVHSAETLPAYEAGAWVRTGGPLGGLGYDIRVRPDNPDIMLVTDAMAGVHISTDAGLTWTVSNDGIDQRGGGSGDVIPVFCVTIDPNNPDIAWAGLQDFGRVYRSEDGGKTWEARTTGITDRQGFTLRGITVEPGNSEVVYIGGELSSWAWAGEGRWGREFDRTKGVVYKTVDAGLHWQEVWRGDSLARYIWVDPTDVNIVYLSTGIFDREAANSDPQNNVPGGVGVLKSTDGGATWTPVNNGLKNLFVGSLFMHPTNPQILLAGTGNNAYYDGGGVYITYDGGENWEYKVGSHIQVVEFALSDPNIAYAGGDGEFFRSEDGGETWLRLVRPIGYGWGPDGVRTGFPIDLQVDPRDPMRLFVNNYGGGNFLSEDGGETWVSVSNGYTGADLTGVAVDPSDPLKIYAIGRSGPFVSADGGATWTGINTVGQNLPEIAEGGRIVVDPADPQHVLMSSAHWGWTYNSKDGGQHWTLQTEYFDALQNLPYPDTNQKFQGAQAFAFAPSNPLRVYQAWGVWRCVTDASQGMCETPTLLNLLVSDDGGLTWAKPEPLNVRYVAEDTVNLRAGAGTDFEKVGQLRQGEILEIVAEEGEWYEIKQGDGTAWIYAPLTTDQAGVALEGLSISSLVVHPQNPDVVWAGTLGKGVFYTANGGRNWQQLDNRLKSFYILSLALDPTNPDILYASTVGQGIYKSTDAGKTWQAVNRGLDANESISAVVIDPLRPEVLYAASWLSGVYVSQDAGASWQLLNEGLLMRSVRALAISSDGSTVYAGTRGGGVFRLGAP